MKIIITSLTVSLIFLGACSNSGTQEKGFSVSPESTDTKDESPDGIAKDSLSFATSPGSILLTGDARHRLVTIYKVNMNEDGDTYTGTNNFYYRFDEYGETLNNQWNNHFMPGFEIVYGYNMINLSHHDTGTSKSNNLFEKPVLIRNIYYPSFSQDTLLSKPVNRNFILVSVYDEDTNRDDFINTKDLRRFYYFGLGGENKRALIPATYSVFQSEYDPANDFLSVYAKADENGNGQADDHEPVHIFWFDLKNPENTGRQY